MRWGPKAATSSANLADKATLIRFWFSARAWKSYIAWACAAKCLARDGHRQGHLQEAVRVEAGHFARLV
jgi:hypothetical protein